MTCGLFLAPHGVWGLDKRKVRKSLPHFFVALEGFRFMNNRE